MVVVAKPATNIAAMALTRLRPNNLIGAIVHSVNPQDITVIRNARTAKASAIYSWVRALKQQFKAAPLKRIQCAKLDRRLVSRVGILLLCIHASTFSGNWKTTGYSFSVPPQRLKKPNNSHDYKHSPATATVSCSIPRSVIRPE